MSTSRGLEDRRDPRYNDCGNDDNVNEGEDNGNDDISHGIVVVMMNSYESIYVLN